MCAPCYIAPKTWKVRFPWMQKLAELEGDLQVGFHLLSREFFLQTADRSSVRVKIMTGSSLEAQSRVHKPHGRWIERKLFNLLAHIGQKLCYAVTIVWLTWDGSRTTPQSSIPTWTTSICDNSLPELLPRGPFPTRTTPHGTSSHQDYSPQDHFPSGLLSTGPFTTRTTLHRTISHQDYSPQDHFPPGLLPTGPFPTRTTPHRTISHQDYSPPGPFPTRTTPHQDTTPPGKSPLGQLLTGPGGGSS